MGIKKEDVKYIMAVPSTLGGVILTTTIGKDLISKIPNPLFRVFARIGLTGISVVVGNAAKTGVDEWVDSIYSMGEMIRDF